MKKNSAKRKGNSFENEVCKLLSLNWSNNEKDDIFHRTDCSGGRFTSRQKRKVDTSFQAGDIGFNDPIGKQLIDVWNIECKSGYGIKRKNTSNILVKTNWCLLDSIDSKQEKTKFEEFWEQCIKDADITKREPILIFKRNNKSICVSFRKIYFKKMLNFYPIPTFNYIEFNGEEDLIIINFKQFLSWISIKDFIKNEM